jgi:PAS domain-containing protein
LEPTWWTTQDEGDGGQPCSLALMAVEVLDCLSEAVLVVGIDFDVRFANRAARRLFVFGGGAAALPGIVARRPGLELVAPADRDRVAAEHVLVVQEPGSTRDVRFEAWTVDGPRIVDAAFSNRLDHPGVTGVVVTLRPTGTSRQHQHVERLLSAMEATADLVTIHAPDGEIVDSNEAAGQEQAAAAR